MIKTAKLLSQLRESELTTDEASEIKSFVGKIVNQISTDNKTSNEIFGEIYTKLRSEVLTTDRHPELLSKFPQQLRILGCCQSGIQINKIINQVYEQRTKSEIDLTDLEICLLAMNENLDSIKKINNRSGTVVTNLNRIDNDLNGEKNVK